MTIIRQLDNKIKGIDGNPSTQIDGKSLKKVKAITRIGMKRVEI